jgi:hypothetical protein
MAYETSVPALADLLASYGDSNKDGAALCRSKRAWPTSPMPRCTSLLPQGILEVPGGIIDVQEGIIDVQEGIIDVQEGIIDVQRGIIDLQRGIIDVHWASAEVQAPGVLASSSLRVSPYTFTFAGPAIFTDSLTPASYFLKFSANMSASWVALAS